MAVSLGRLMKFYLATSNLDSMSEVLDGDDAASQSKAPRFGDHIARQELQKIKEILASAENRSSTSVDSMDLEHLGGELGLAKAEAASIAESMLKAALQEPGGNYQPIAQMSATTAGGGKFLPTTEDDCEKLCRREELEELQCRICEDFLCQPTTLQCGHTYCASCLEDSPPAPLTPVSSAAGTCLWPGCHGLLSRRDLRINLTLSNVLGKWYPREVERADCSRRARMKMSSGQFAEALVDYNRALEIDPNNVRLLSQRSLASLSLRQYQDSLADAEHCCELQPHLAEGFYRRGIAHYALGHLESAVCDLLQCARLRRAAEQDIVNVLTSVLQDYFRDVFPAKSVPGTVELIQDLLSRRLTSGCCRQEKFQHVVSAVSLGKPQVDDVLCPLCYHVLFQPITTPCGHLFCRSCLYRSLDHQPHCPWCRGSLADLLAQQRKDTTTAMEYLLRTHFSGEYQKRHDTHVQELGITPDELDQPRVKLSIFVCTFAFPEMPCPLHIYEPRYRLMMRRCMESGLRRFGMCLPCGGQDGVEYASVGTVLEITDVSYARDGRMLIDCYGRQRFKVVERNMVDGYNSALIEWFADEQVDATLQDEVQELHDQTYRLAENFWGMPIFEHVCSRFGSFPPSPGRLHYSENGPAWMWYCISWLPLSHESRLHALISTSLKDRLELLNNWFITNDSPFSLLAVVSYFQLSYFSS